MAFLTSPLPAKAEGLSQNVEVGVKKEIPLGEKGSKETKRKTQMCEVRKVVENEVEVG